MVVCSFSSLFVFIMTATAAIWEQFASAKLRWKDDQARAQLAYPAYVITGCNPHGRLASPNRNRFYHCLLHSYLASKFPSATLVEVTGHSVDEDWEEVSWAISGPAIEEIALVAKLFRQLAFFKINDSFMEVVDTDSCRIV